MSANTIRGLGEVLHSIHHLNAWTMEQDIIKNSIGLVLEDMQNELKLNLLFNQKE